MAERANVDWSPIDKLADCPYVVYQTKTAKIRKDLAKGITEDVEVQFSTPVVNITSDVEAADLYEKLGAETFSAIVNLACDMRKRGNATQSKRMELTADPLKKELKSLSAFGFSDEKQNKFVELRKGGMPINQALAAIVAG